MNGPSARPRTVRCPQCGGPSLFDPANRWRPFCSERCRQIDLGAWATESYRIAPPAPEPGADDAPSDDEPTRAT
jgi:endogenous inhibitor of DNA gyrase (YacG/DUF329 family)